MAETVAVYHPDLETTKERPVVVPRKRYETVMRDKGWRIHPPREKKEKE